MENPFRPGAGHLPPYLAGRDNETKEFQALLKQKIILQNLIITGLRGIGKTVLLESLKPLASKEKWLWAGTDCSESASISEESMALRILTDIALITSNVVIANVPVTTIGFSSIQETQPKYLNFDYLVQYFKQTPGLISDKLKATLEQVWLHLKPLDVNGIVFAYDEAQTLSDHTHERQYPLSLLLDVFQSIQKKNIPFMLLLTGLPALLTKLVETRTYSERLFKVIVLERLGEKESREAILNPIKNTGHPLKFNERSIDLIVKESGGYPYFIQFICREVFDIFLVQISNSEQPSVPIDAITQKLDNDFFAGRWAKATDRERDLLKLIAISNVQEFKLSEIAALSNTSGTKPFSTSQISQMFRKLIDNGLIYKNRRGSYSFAVPLLEKFILRNKHIL